MKIRRYKITNNDAQRIIDAIDYGTRRVADKIYPYTHSVYDEDAGVFTDYGENDPQRTWAQIHFVGLCGAAIVAVKWGEQDTDLAEIDILEVAIPAVVQLVFALFSDPDTQREIWESRAQELWESDGHYGRETRDEFIEKTIALWGFDRRGGRAIVELLQNDYHPDVTRLTGELIVGKNHREIREQLKLRTEG